MRCGRDHAAARPLRISWQDDTTLKVETDTGTQTRLFRFGDAPAPAGPTWRGPPIAQWNVAARDAQGGRRICVRATSARMVRPTAIAPRSPKCWDLNTLPSGDRWVTVIGKVEDPRYFTRAYTTSSDFKKLPDATGWNPTLRRKIARGVYSVAAILTRLAGTSANTMPTGSAAPSIRGGRRCHRRGGGERGPPTQPLPRSTHGRRSRRTCGEFLIAEAAGISACRQPSATNCGRRAIAP